MVRVSMLKINGAHQISKADSIFCWCIQCICTWIHIWICILCVFVFVTCLSRNHPSQPKLLGPPRGGHSSQIPARGDMFNFIQNQCKKFWLKPMFARKFKRTLLTSMLSISILLLMASPCKKSEKPSISTSHQSLGFWPPQRWNGKYSRETPDFQICDALALEYSTEQRVAVYSYVYLGRVEK